MSKSPNQRTKLLYLRKILLDKTDEQNPMSMPEIISALATYDIHAERKPPSPRFTTPVLPPHFLGKRRFYCGISALAMVKYSVVQSFCALLWLAVIGVTILYLWGLKYGNIIRKTQSTIPIFY